MNTTPVSAHALLATDPEGIAAAANLIKAGRLVVVPTETVYGIAVNLLSPEAREAGRRLKGDVEGKATSQWVIHVATPKDALAWAPGLSALGRRLMNKALPGPVAFQLKLSEADLASARARLGAAADEALREGYLMLRCPDLSATQQVLVASGQMGAVAIMGAGVVGQQSVFEASDLPEKLRIGEGRAPHIAAVLDGGPTRYRKPSTVVRIAADTFSVVREGVIDARIIDRMADLQVLFICSGNTCRSPMAAALMARVLADRLGISPSELPLRHILVQSAGLHANRGLRATAEALQAVAPLKGELGTHFSQPATTELLRRADVIYTMTEAHRQEIVEIMPWAAERTFRLDPEADVEDPIGAGLDLYQQVANRLLELVQRRAGELPL